VVLMKRSLCSRDRSSPRRLPADWPIST
jgi:hypothetical protein